MNREVLRHACSQVVPALLTPDGKPPLRECFLGAVEAAGDDALIVVVEPLAGGPIDADRVVLSFRWEERDYQLVGQPLRGLDGAMRIRVLRGPDERPPRVGRLVLLADSAVCTFVPEGTGLGRCHPPLLDIGPRGLSVESSVPFAPGTILRDLSVVARGEILRTGEGTVANCVEVLRVCGRKSYRCGIRLRQGPRVVDDRPAQESVDVDDPERVRAVLWGLSDLGCGVVLSIGSQETRGNLVPVTGDRARTPDLRCALASTGLPRSGVVEVSATMYGTGYRFMARMRAFDDDTVRLFPAPVIRHSCRRQEERITLQPALDAAVEFRHPADGRVIRRRLLDVSSDGFAIQPERHDAALWSGLPLHDVTLRLPGLTLRPPQAAIRTVAVDRLGVQMSQLSERDADRLRVELVRYGEEPVAFHDGENLEAILSLHRKVKLLEPPMEANLHANLDETRRTWRLAHNHPDGLMRTAIGVQDGAVVASLNLARAYDRSWCLQHGAVLHPTVRPTPGALYTSLMSLVHPRPDGDYLCAFVAEAARSQHVLMDSFFNAWSTPEHRGRHAFRLFIGETGPASRDIPDGVRRLRGADEMFVEHAALRTLDPTCARALSLQRGEIELPLSRAAFRAIGLERGREAWGVWRRDRCVAILLREWASPGLSLSSVLSAAMLLPVHVHADPDGSARASLIRLALTLPLHGNPPNRLLFVPAGVDATAAEAAGFHYGAGCCLYAFHRYGLREYHRFIGARYGLVHAMLRNRPGVAA